MSTIFYPQWNVRCEEAVSPFASWFTLPKNSARGAAHGCPIGAIPPSMKQRVGGEGSHGRSEDDDLFSRVLPVEMQLEVLGWVAVEDLVRCVPLVCRRWRALTESDALWRLVASRLFGGPEPWSSLLREHGTNCSPAPLHMFLSPSAPMPHLLPLQLPVGGEGGSGTAAAAPGEGEESGSDDDIEEADYGADGGRYPCGIMKQAVVCRLRDLRVFWPFKSARNLYFCAERGYVRMVAAILRDPGNLTFTRDQIATAANLAAAKGFRDVVDTLRPAIQERDSNSVMEIVL